MRKNDEIPAVLYGGEKVIHFAVTKESVRKLIYTPEIFAVELTIDGNKTMAIVKDIQFQPVSDAILHIDFLEIFENKPVQMEVPVVLEGHAEGVKAGGKLSLEMRKLKVNGIYTQIPNRVEIDITDLGLGKKLYVGAVQVAEGLKLMNPADACVARVKATRASQQAAAAAAPAKGKKK